MARNPFDEIERVFDRMSSQFEPLEGDLFEGTVAVDVEDAGDAYVVTADLPGYEREDVDVQLTGRRLTLSAERDESAADESGTEDGRYIRRERHHRSVSRTVRLPDAVDETGTEAQYNNGVLTVTLPKADVTDGHDIPVN
jgi:HSP20 family protein